MRLGTNGIGLLEVLVGGALVSGLMVTVMKLNESGNQGTAKLEKRTDIVYLDREISGYLGDPSSCINSLGANTVDLTAFTGTSKSTFTKLHNRDDVLIFTIPYARGTVALKQIYLTDYKPALKTARLIREYEFQVSKQRKEVRTFGGEVSIVENAGKVGACVLQGSAGGDGPWVVEPNQISYSGGNVGIGKTLVEFPLDVNGTIRSSGNLAGILLDPRDGTGDTWQWYNSTGDGVFLWHATLPGHTAPGHAMGILNNGTVGIGTTNPSSMLHIVSNIPSGFIKLDGPSSVWKGINTHNTSSNRQWQLMHRATPDGVLADDFIIHTHDGVAWYDVITFKKSGYVGIGTTSPRARLDVYGGYFRVGNSVTNPNEGGQMALDDGTGVGTWVIDSYGADGSEALRFFRDSETPMPNALVIAASGNVGIGRAAPTSKLHIESGTTSGLNIVGPYPTTILSENDTGTSFWNVVDGSTWQVRLNGYGTSLMSLDASGNLWIAGTYSPVPSDERLKKDIVQLQSPLQRLLQIEGVNYHWKPELKKGSELQLGVIAQDVEKVFPEAVLTNKEGMKGVNYSALVAPVIEAIRELNSKIATLFKTTDTHSQEIVVIKEQNKELRKANEDMMVRLQRMEKMLSESKINRQ